MNPQTSTYYPKYPGVSGSGMPVFGVFEGGNYPFGFGGQMKDNEVYGDGNAYSAMFWEYDARLGRRWNMDPVIKPQISVYSCFSNNPIWEIDSNGDDDYTVDKKGLVKLLNKTDDKQDKLIALGKSGKIEYDDKGNIKNQIISVEIGILNNMKSESKVDKKSNPINFDYYEIKGDQKAKELFEFFATNTGVEWGQLQYGKDENYISTDHSRKTNSGTSYLCENILNNKKILRADIHSHSYYSNRRIFGPSPNDKRHFVDMMAIFGKQPIKPVFKIFHPDEGYVRYNNSNNYTPEDIERFVKFRLPKEDWDF